MLVRWVALFLLVLLSHLNLWADTSFPDKKNVLVISSYSPLRENGTGLIAFFTDNLKSKMDVKVSVEYMDCESRPVFSEWVGWMTQLFNAYIDKPDVVVLLGGEAWSTYKSICIEEWRDISVVLGHLKLGFVDYENGIQKNIDNIDSLPKIMETFDGFKVTGYYYKDYLDESLKLIKRLQPNVQYVAFWYDNRYSLDFFQNYLNSLFEKIDSLDLCYLSGDTLATAQLLDSIAQMDDRYALFSAGWYTDVNHYAHAYSTLQNELARYTTKFMFQIQDQNYKNLNCIGGYFVLSKDLGKDLANITGDVLNKGIENSPSFQLTPSPPRYYINYPTFIIAGLDKKLLPKDVVFYNTKPSLWEERPHEVILVLLLGFIMVILFVVVLYNRKRKEEAYKAENERMLRLLESMPDMAVLFDSDQNIVDIINPQKNVLLGFKQKDLVGMNMRDVIFKYPRFTGAAQLIIKNVVQTTTTKEVLLFDYTISYHGKNYYTQARTVPFGNNGVICFVHDVTSHVMAELEIRKLKTFLQSIVDNLPIALLVKDASNDFRYLFYNKKVSEFYNDRPAYVIGKNDFEVNDPSAEQYRKEDELVCHTEYPLSFDRILYDKKGEPYRWGITYKTRLINNDGSCYVITIVSDTTEIRKKEIELGENKFKLELALEVAQIVLWEYSVDTRMLSSPNPSVIEHKGLSLQEFMKLMEPEDAVLLESGLKKIEEGKSDTVNLQARITFPEEQQKWFDIHAAIYERDKDGRITRIIGLRRDITALKMTDELIELRNKAEEANRLKSAFLANMSHEIRTPLNAIIGFSSLIAQTDDREEIDEYCKIVETNNELLLQLINDILDLSKIEAGQLEFNYSDVVVSDMFYFLEQTFKGRTKEGVKLVCEVPETSYIIYSEKNRLTQVVSNFLSNACKFTSDGFIKMGYKQVEEGLYFYVSDTGKGIASENLSGVFNRFAKFDNFVQGTGLGLSICQSIVQYLGGEIGVESELGKGSVFWFTIPCEPRFLQQKENEGFLSHSISDTNTACSKLKTILVAEDNDSNYLLLLNILKKDYQLVRASNGKDAVRLHQEIQPDLILMDIKMPVMDGLEATMKIRQIDHRTPIIALTAHAFNNDKDEALRVGCNDFLTKPINAKLLKSILSSFKVKDEK